jgi:hypothetical protein
MARNRAPFSLQAAHVIFHQEAKTGSLRRGTPRADAIGAVLEWAPSGLRPEVKTRFRFSHVTRLRSKSAKALAISVDCAI